MKTVDVLVVDDSAFMRRAVIRMLGSDPQLRVVGQASDGEEALRLLEGLAVDVVTLDLEMPGIGGLATLARMRRDHRQVVVLSGAAVENAAVTLQALDLGAFDVVAKPAGGPLAIHSATRELVSKVRGAAGLKELAGPKPTGHTGSLGARRPAPPPVHAQTIWDLVVIGTSTGGPPALQQVIPALPADFPVPVVVLQHMPPGYTRALAERLNRLAAVTVREAAEGDRLLPGTVLIAPSGRQLSFRRGAQGPAVHLLDTCPFPSYYSPCIDYSFQEAARHFHHRVLGVVMTGMGSDGALGLQAIKEAGGAGWGQDEATSVIYGMPRAAAEAGALDAVFPLGELAARLSAAVKPVPIAPTPNPQKGKLTP